MAHYAFINADGIVTEVITGKDEADLDSLPNGFDDWESYYLTKRPDAAACKRTSYNTMSNAHADGGVAFRGNYAGIGFTYDSDNDVFYPPRPFDSWLISELTDWAWIAPIPMPDLTEEQISAGSYYSWDEDAYQADTFEPKTAGWVLVES